MARKVQKKRGSGGMILALFVFAMLGLVVAAWMGWIGDPTGIVGTTTPAPGGGDATTGAPGEEDGGMSKGGKAALGIFVFLILALMAYAYYLGRSKGEDEEAGGKTAPAKLTRRQWAGNKLASPFLALGRGAQRVGSRAADTRAGKAVLSKVPSRKKKSPDAQAAKAAENAKAKTQRNSQERDADGDEV